MYVRTPRALVWIDQSTNQGKPAPDSPGQYPVPRQERWARYPLQLECGRCVAVRMNAGKLELGCMVGKRLIWLPEPQQMLSSRRAQAWLREAF